MEKKIETIVV